MYDYVLQYRFDIEFKKLNDCNGETNGEDME